MGIRELLIMLLVGAVAGWLAGKLVTRSGFGLIGNVVVGTLGAVVASLILPRLGFGVEAGWLMSVLQATLGAVLLLVIVRVVKRV